MTPTRTRLYVIPVATASGYSSVAVSTSYLTLGYLFKDRLLTPVGSNHFGDCLHLSASYVVELQYYRVRLSAVNTWVSEKVLSYRGPHFCEPVLNMNLGLSHS